MFGQTVRTTFVSVIRKEVVKGVCLKCGTSSRRTIKVENTINPFNRRKDGVVKTSEEVNADVVSKLKKLVKTAIDKFYCRACVQYLEGE